MPRPVIIKGGEAYLRLTQGYLAVVDVSDLHLVIGHNWTVNRIRKTTYAARVELQNGKKVKLYLHRVILGAGPGQIVDHRDRNGLNCKRGNLRLATPSQNQMNQGLRSDSVSGYRGVGFCKKTGRWAARIKRNGASEWLGRFDTPKEAHDAYCAASSCIHGEFGCT